MAEAETTLDDASKKFQEAAALALFNWGNVHMCSARKAMDGGRDPPLEEGGPPGAAIATATEAETVTKKLDEAKTRYEAALAVKPDFHDATIALAQRRYERARFLCAAAGLSGAGGPSKGNKDSDAAEAEFSGACADFDAVLNALPEEPPKPEPKEKKEGEAPAEEEEAQPSMKAQVQVMWGNTLFEQSDASQARKGVAQSARHRRREVQGGGVRRGGHRAGAQGSPRRPRREVSQFFSELTNSLAFITPIDSLKVLTH
jgi:tetratricopeptide (TPR) repeat protein